MVSQASPRSAFTIPPGSSAGARERFGCSAAPRGRSPGGAERSGTVTACAATNFEEAESLGSFRMMSGHREPVAFEVYEPGVYLHGTKADLAVGEMLVSRRESNFEVGRVMSYVYFTATLDAATWGAELASGEGRGRYSIKPSIATMETAM